MRGGTVVGMSAKPLENPHLVRGRDVPSQHENGEDGGGQGIEDNEADRATS